LPLEFMVNGARKTVALPSVLSVNGADTYRAAALQGLGLIQLPRYSVEQDLADGTLVECLPDTPPSPTSVYVLYPRSRQLSLRVRVFIDWVADEYASHVGSVATADIARSSHLLAP
jgi:DNA-binding transcriptional LysR family regulator